MTETPFITQHTCLRVGITGGIGSGKTTVCNIFASMGVPVYDADYWAKWLIVNDPKLKSAIQNTFGEDAYLPDGTYNRTYISNIVFNNPEQLAALNAIVHPAVEIHGKTWHEAWASKGQPYTLKEAALMIESGNYRHLDRLIVVTAPQNIRLQRVMSRDGMTQTQIEARMTQQLPEEKKLALAHYVINNDGDHALIPQIVAIHRDLIEIVEKNKNNLEKQDLK